MKKLTIITAIIVSLFSLTSVAWSGQGKLKSAYVTDTVKVKVLGKTLETDVIAAQQHGEKGYRNYVSAADLASALGYNVKWDQKTQTVLISSSSGYDGELNVEKVKKFKDLYYNNEANLLEGVSNEQLDWLHNIAIYSNEAGLPDYAPFLFVLDDYKMYSRGSKAAFSDYWSTWAQ
ncbi:Copper amine oxidase N-terminal domain-containing protein [Paenibacillus algorifonticola]|uniref:Copper amine oxidase N-terminal domain-containing protein n=1 Tax=Paenibacillus algorifonticola TaxID=684063 RepID=A0A1I2AHV8_9BACL|nr:stalk domain-containing protein [Paenibacillus algorifonticola]SFE43462.1 Copper amine oxidase N-terminal domain-containing protein [Paenibacillus algorifonticola]